MVMRAVPMFSDATGQGADHGPATPVPGTITAVPVAVGDLVAAGDTLVVLEAMKMEQPVSAPHAGVVHSLPFDEGSLVPGGAVLA